MFDVKAVEQEAKDELAKEMGAQASGGRNRGSTRRLSA